MPQYARYLIGIQMEQKNESSNILVSQVFPGSPAEAAGIRAGDTLLEAGETPLTAMAKFQEYLAERKSEPFRLTYLRDGVKSSVEIAAREEIPYSIGVDLSALDHPTPFQQFYDTIELSYKSLRGMLVGLANKIGLTRETSTLKPSHMSGPLGIGMVLFNSVHHSSLWTGIYFMVMISFALAIFNLLPLPVLDGGHILFGLIELVFRRPVPVVVAEIPVDGLCDTADRNDALRDILRRKASALPAQSAETGRGEHPCRHPEEIAGRSGSETSRSAAAPRFRFNR